MKPVTFAPESSFLPQIAAVVVAFLVAACLIVWLARRFGGKDWPDAAVYSIAFLALIVAVFGLIFFGIKSDNEYKSRATNALSQQLGYTDIDLDYTTFTASDAGAYVKGRIVHVKDNDYIVVLESN